MEQSILTPSQRKVLTAIAAEPRLVNYYLSGGTALAAYYFQHRVYDDLDFFVFDDPDAVFLHEFSRKLSGELAAKTCRFEKNHDRYQFYFEINAQETLKVKFTRYHFAALDKPQTKNGLRVDSLRDIAANKLMAMLDRFDPKDFVDLFFILQRNNLGELRQDTEKKFGIKIDGIFLGSEMGKVRRIVALPKMLKPLNIEELKSFFTNQAKQLSSEILL